MEDSFIIPRFCKIVSVPRGSAPSTLGPRDEKTILWKDCRASAEFEAPLIALRAAQAARLASKSKAKKKYKDPVDDAMYRRRQ